MSLFHNEEKKQKPQSKAEQVIKPLIPPDARDKVFQSYRQSNQIIREHIRTETALKLSEGDSRFSIPVRIIDGFPDSLEKLIDQYSDPVLWRLILGQPRLGAIIEGLKFLLKDWELYEMWPRLPEIAINGAIPLERSLEIVNALQLLAITSQVREDIKKINKDILGAYFFPPDKSPWIELYWMPIAMIAAMLEVKIEDLTLVVLAHELTHGYTHIGRDIDGTQWNDTGFRSSDLKVVEGLAQFYTEVVMEKLAARTPGAKVSFEKLLELQAGPYLAHKSWVKEDQQKRGETVRFALVAARSQGDITYEAWSKMLVDTAGSLKKR